MVLRSTFDFTVRRSWLLLPSFAAGAGAGYAVDGFAPVMAGGAALGLAPALAAGLGLELRGHRVRTADDLDRLHDLETLGAIGRFEQSPGSAFPKDEYPEALQAYRALGASLRARGGHELRTVLVTSAGPEEGKSTTAANLATVLAQSGNKVVLMDADLRWSSLRSTHAGATSLGLAGLLLNYLNSPQLALVRTNEPNLFLLPSGALPPNPHELLAGPRLGEVVSSLRRTADYVIIDSPPVLEAEDARLLASAVDATLLVTLAGKTRSRAVDKALKLLMAADSRPLGAVLNRVKAARTALPLPEAEPATIPAEPAYVAPEPAFEPFSVAAFRKGPPKPTSANIPRPYEPEAEPAIFRLAQQGFNVPPDPATNGVDHHAEELQPASASRTLRVVQPDERPAVPAAFNEALDEAPEKEGLEEATAVETSPGPVGLTPPSEMALPAFQENEPEVSVDDVLAHMEETLRLIREMRREKSVTST